MDQSIKRRELTEKWRSAELEGRTHLGPLQAGPLRPTFSHFSTKAEWDKHREEVQQAQANGAPF